MEMAARLLHPLKRRGNLSMLHFRYRISVFLIGFHCSAFCYNAYAQVQGDKCDKYLNAGQVQYVGIAQGGNGYYIGKVSTSGGRYTVNLVDKNGHHLRRFYTDQGGENSFRFVAEPTDQVQLKAKVDADYCLELKQPKLIQSESSDNLDNYFISPILKKLAADKDKPGAIESFWREIEEKGAPLVENSEENGQRIVTFLQRGAKRNVRLFGSPSGDHENLSRFVNTDIWYKSFKVPADTRLTYQLAVDVPDIDGSYSERRGAIIYTAKADPLNPKVYPINAPDAYNQDSLLELDQAPKQRWVQTIKEPVGHFDRFVFHSSRLGNQRNITLYQTAGSGSLNVKPILLLVFDGQEYQSKVPLPSILDNMVSAKIIPPVTAVFVHNINRTTRAEELPGNPAFADFLAKELFPEIVKRTQRKFPPERVVLAGSSFGGLAAMTVALRYPKVFGNVLSMSGSFWWSPKGTPAQNSEFVSYNVANMSTPPLHVFLSAGLFEGGHSGGSQSLLDANRHLRDVLIAKSVPVIYREYASGHDYAVWQGVISDGLIALFPQGVKLGYQK